MIWRNLSLLIEIQWIGQHVLIWTIYAKNMKLVLCLSLCGLLVEHNPADSATKKEIVYYHPLQLMLHSRNVPFDFNKAETRSSNRDFGYVLLLLGW